MNYGLLFRTIKHLKPTQVFYQVKNRLIKPGYVQFEAAGEMFNPNISIFKTEPVLKYKCLENNKFTFLNLEHEFAGWNFTENGMLWAYNQNYFDWINQKGISKQESCKWIDLFIENLPNNKVGLDPYPIALRSINWIKFLCKYPECATKPRLDSLYSQLILLGKKLEYHLLGNHLLEDAYAMYIGAIFFRNNRLLKKSEALIWNQLKEQILPDGSHYEQSPMYHCILLDRLLDCINISVSTGGLKNTDKLNEVAIKMLGHLESIIWEDGSIPLFNDSANGIAPAPREIFAYAKRLGLEWEPIPLKECGYRRLNNKQLEAIVDVGNITAIYQPGHTHADTFNYELRIFGRPFIVDSGISTYNKDMRRQYERSTSAHNTVCVNDSNSSEVWGGFRVGRQANVTLIEDTYSRIQATHNGYGEKVHKRTFLIEDDCFCVKDKTQGIAANYIHFSPEIVVREFGPNKIVTDLAVIELNNVDHIELIETEVSKEYNKRRKTYSVKLLFKESMDYYISV